MDRKLQLIAHLYEEKVDGLEPLDELLLDPELRDEYRALRESRFALDHRAPVRPDPRSIDAIMAAARTPSADRPPLRLVRIRRLMVPAMAAAAVLLLAVLAVPLMMTDSARGPQGADDQTVAPHVAGEATGAPQTAGEEKAGISPAENLLRSLPPAAPVPAPATPASAEALADAADDLTSWDSGRDVRRLSRRIATLRAAGVDEWDGEAVPLETLPDEAGRNDLLPAGARRPGN
jgi:hypothetical protein